ncbi:hypothetical protein ZYGM_002114 [Zygosaccharomyces mellis]|uniref:Homeobox domain-containing protein n=1 Tax=Zygosaccharomyces mellis TaxID=42258 RepID=A0A4C2EH42_9SACH|nr:hypothetical protein ZYGM_002114 [Zygosaccharomyces mellis]
MSNEFFIALNKLQQQYLSSFHKIFKTTIGNSSLSSREKSILIRCISQNYSSNLHITLSTLAIEYGGYAQLIDGSSVKGPALKGVSGDVIKNKVFSKECRRFLESVFEKKKTLTPRERNVVAATCGLTSIQVRRWVCNLLG